MDEQPRLGFRRWLAWQLQRLSARIYDDEVDMDVVVKDADGSELAKIGVLGDTYGKGVVTLLPQSGVSIHLLVDGEEI